MQQIQDYTPDKLIEMLKTKSIHDKIIYTHPKKTNNKSIRMSIGRVFFNIHLPDDYPLIDEPVNKPILDRIIKDLINKYSPEECCKITKELQQNAFRIGTLSPSTFVIDSFIPPDDWIQKKKEFEKRADKLNPTEFYKEAQKLTTELVNHIERKGYRIHNVLKGGIKGNPIDDWKNLLVGKGYVIDIEGNLLGPVVHGISEGFTKKEYFDSANEARRGFYYKASLTAIPGYLARKLAMASANITLADKDCNTKRYFELYVTKDNIKSITGRYFLNNGKLDVSTIENLTPYINQTIKLRSPLFCQSKKNQICPICFGKLAEKLDTKTLGILAAGVVNLITINALMKMRHKTSQINAREVDFPQIFKDVDIDLADLEKYIKIEKNVITAKSPVKIIIDKKDYTDIELIETLDYYQIPGILPLVLNSKKSITLPFDFQIKLFKPQDIETISNNVFSFNYEPDEKIISQEYIIDSTDPTVIRRLFDAGFKYLKTPEILVNQIYKQIPTIDLTYIELIVQNMFRSKVNPQNSCRLTQYKNCSLFSQKQLPFLNSWINSLAFENINKGIKNGLLSEQDIRYDPIEKIAIERFGQN